MTRPANLSERNNSRWSALAVGLTLFVIAINLLAAWRNDVDLRRHSLSNAESDGRQILTAFADHALRLLDYGDSHLRAARAVYRRLGGSEDFREFLAATKVVRSESLIVAMTFSDRTGQIVFDSEKRQMPNVTAADLDYFRYFQSHDDDVPYIDPTRFGRLWQRYQFRIVRRLSRDGQFDGVAILNMRPEDLANFTRQYDLGPHAAYTILTLDHRLIVRQPMASEGAYGEYQDGLELWRQLLTAPTGKYWATGPIDGRKRLNLYRTLPDYPLVVQVGIDEQDMLNHEARARIPNVQNAMVFTVVMCVLGLLVVIILRKSGALEHLALFDSLTELPNRRMLLDRLQSGLSQAKRFHRPLAVMLLDLDHFKEVNDTFGHEVGDRLLKEVARRLTACVRSVDTVSRPGGDEFIILLPEISRHSDATLVAEKIIQAFSEPIRIDERVFQTTTSIGIAVYPIDGSDDAQTLIRKADKAMYMAKNAGRNGYRLFDDHGSKEGR